MLTKWWYRIKGVPDVSAEGFNHIDKRIFREFNKFRPEGPKPLFCYVPFNSLTFSFRGKVYACTYNREIVLGHYPQQTIDEIWKGKEAQKLREHMRHNDLDYGCQHCKYFFDKEKFSNLKPMVFDKYSDNNDGQYPRVMEFEMSNTCNYECQMCSGEVSSLIRKNRDKLPPIEMPYDGAFVDQLEPYIPHLKEAKFFGGEPFLIDIYHDIWDRMLDINPDIKFFVITNGSVWNNRVRNLLDKGKFEIAISLDSLQKEKLERIRLGAKYERVMENITHFNQYAKKHFRYITISFTLQKDNWEEFPDMIRFSNDIGAYIFVSYLEWPEHFAIADYPLDKLIEIRRYMDNHEFSGIIMYKKHNAQCYEDFKTYLDGFIQQKNTGRYLEYRFGEEAQAKTKGDVAAIALFNLSEGTLKEKLELQITTYIENHHEQIVSKKVVLEKVEDLMASMNEADRKKIYSLMCTTETGTLLNDLQKNDLNTLREMGLRGAKIMSV
jgi:radical SAM protein with 4Fe4S-binding SPASM domain